MAENQQPIQKSWDEILTEVLKNIELCNPTDRMEYSTIIFRILQTLQTSLNNWFSWYKDIRVLNNLTKEDFEFFYPSFKETSVALLTIDQVFTKRMNDSYTEKIKLRAQEEANKEKNIKQIKQEYVS